MLQNYLAAALRSLARNRFYSIISICGLALGICAALITALVVRNQYSYDRFIPGYERVYLVVSTLMPQKRAPDYNGSSFSEIASLLKLRFSEIEEATRLSNVDVVLRNGDVTAKESVYWADPNAFDVLPLPVVAGDLATALRRSDGIVLPRSIARKYFGRDAPIGESLQVDGEHVMTVMAVVEDLPHNGTQLRTGIFASGLASWSELTRVDNNPANRLSNPSGMAVTVQTYLRLSPNASVDRLQSAMPAFLDSVMSFRLPGLRVTLTLVRLDEVHLFHGFNPGAHGRLAMSVAIGLVILLIACINFINLSTARASQRAREVMVRKVAGAGRGALIAQFLGESLIYVALAMCMALALTELALPYVNALINGGARLDYGAHPMLIGWIVLGALLLSVIAGTYPAFMLASFRPTQVIKGRVANSSGANVTRQILVAFQFALLIALTITAIVVYQQRDFATREALRVATDQHLMIRTPCREALKTSLQALPGVRGVACVSSSFLNGAEFSNVRLTNGVETALGGAGVEPGALELFDLVPLAGRFFTAADAASRTHVVINETAVRRFGFESPAAAIGKAIPQEGEEAGATEIIGVVRDFALYSVEKEIAPTVYRPRARRFDLMDVKLTGRQIPETLAALDGLWKATGADNPPQYFFLTDYVRDLYLTVLRFAHAFGGMSFLAVVLASLGLIGLSTSMTDRRRKEIGVRKAMGAGTASILQLLVWQFTKPVLWAALIAWPVSAWLMSRWLEGFAYHVDLSPWPFVTAAALALAVALLTVSAHSYAVARSKPVEALRYE